MHPLPGCCDVIKGSKRMDVKFHGTLTDILLRLVKHRIGKDAEFNVKIAIGRQIVGVGQLHQRPPGMHLDQGSGLDLVAEPSVICRRQFGKLFDQSGGFCLIQLIIDADLVISGLVDADILNAACVEETDIRNPLHACDTEGVIISLHQRGIP